jgi:transcriptional repressor NrdR
VEIVEKDCQMLCPYCHSIDDKVVDSRLTDSDSVIRRRRECLSCNKRFTTFERMEEVPLFVKKRNGDKELFNRNKILEGLKKACEKRDISEVVLEKITDDIEERLRQLPGAEAPSKEIGLLILNKLRELDEVAYLRFASVYKEFNDVSQFEEEVAMLEKLSPPKSIEEVK